MNKDLWKLTDDEYEYIKGEVVHLFTLHRIKCVPVSGFELAIKMGITLVSYSSLSKKSLEAAILVSEDGFCLICNNREVIYYNDIDKSYERQNWTVLHEIGHLALDHVGNSTHEEDEANFFAKYAIAPPVLIHKIGANTVEKIYDAFDISFESAEYAFEYYTTWLIRYQSIGVLTEYEKDLLKLYGLCA